MNSNQNRFTINGLNWSVTAENASGASGEIRNEVFVASTYEDFSNIFEQAITDAAGSAPTINLGGAYFARTPGGDWGAYSPSTFNGTATVNGVGASVSGSMRLTDAPDNWTRDTTNFTLQDNVWEISTDGVTGNGLLYYDYTQKWAKAVGADNVLKRTETTLNEVVDTSRGFVFMTEPSRDFYNEQPQAAVWPAPPDYALRYPISLQSNWVPIVSNNTAPVVNGQVYTQQETDYFAQILNGESFVGDPSPPDPDFYNPYDANALNNSGSGNIIVGFKIWDEGVKATMRQMLLELEGPAKCTDPDDYTTAKPWKLSCCVRSGPNDIDDAQIKSWNEVPHDSRIPGATDDIEIFFHRDSIDIFRSGSGYVEFVFQGDRSFIKEEGQWVVERPEAANDEPYVIDVATGATPEPGATTFDQPVPKQPKTIVYRAFGDTTPDAYYPVASDLFNNNQQQAIDFYDVTFVGGGRAINGYSEGGVAYAIQHNNNYDIEYYLANGEHNPNEAWTNLHGCRLGYCYFGNRGMVNMYDCYSTDIMKIAQGVADGSENFRSVFCGAWQRETIIVLGNIGAGAASNIPVRRTKVKDCLFYQAMTNHGQGVSFYADANLNCEMEHCLFIDCQRAFSTQPNSRRWTSNNPGPGVSDGPDGIGNCAIFNNMSINDTPLDVYSVPGQFHFANNGGSDYWVNADYSYYCEHNSLILNPDFYADFYNPDGDGDGPGRPAANADITPSYMTNRSAMDLGEIFAARCTVRNNVYSAFKVRRDPADKDFDEVADLAALNALTPSKDDRVIVLDQPTHKAYLYDVTWGWLPTRAKIAVDDSTERALLAASFTGSAYTTTTGASYNLEAYDIVLDKAGDQCYQWRSTTAEPDDDTTYDWVAIDDPYVDRLDDYVNDQDTGRKQYY